MGLDSSTFPYAQKDKKPANKNIKKKSYKIDMCIID